MFLATIRLDYSYVQYQEYVQLWRVLVDFELVHFTVQLHILSTRGLLYWNGTQYRQCPNICCYMKGVFRTFSAADI